MSPLIDKILFMIDRRQSGLQDYSLFSSQVASNTLFYCTFNVRSAQLLMDMGVLTKMLDITRHFLLDQDGDAPLRYDYLNIFKLCYLEPIKGYFRN